MYSGLMKIKLEKKRKLIFKKLMMESKFLRDAMLKYMPKDIIRGKKQGFSMPQMQVGSRVKV